MTLGNNRTDEAEDAGAGGVVTATSATRLRTKLRSGEPVLGALLSFASPELVEMIGLAGYDFVTIDIEHESMDDSAIMSMVRAGDAQGLPVVIRSRINERVGPLLNFGAAGVQVPDVEGPTHARRIVDLVRFPPRGKRPPTLLSRIAGYGAHAPPAGAADDDPIVIAMVEHVDVALDMDELLEVDGVDAFYVGPADLTASMVGASPQDVQDMINHIVGRCASASTVVAVGVVSSERAGPAVVSTIDDLPLRMEQGVRLFVVAVNMFLSQQLVDYRRRLKAALPL